MKKTIFLTTLLALPVTALAQEDKPEHMEVTASRIPGVSFGPVANPSGPIGPTHGCAEPGCGEMPQDPGGSGAITQQQKNVANKKAKEKAKQNKDKLAENMKNDKPTWQKILDWMNGVSIKLGAEGDFLFEIEHGDTRVRGQGCLKYQAELNEKNPSAAGGRCVERKLDAVPVQKANGVYENQLEVSYAIYDTCYWEKTCRVEYITFIAGSPQELASFINDTVGEVVL